MYETVVVSTVVMHFAFIAYVLAGGFLALRWRRTMWLHVPAVIWGIGIAAKRVDCPLTWVERWARTKAAMTPLSISRSSGAVCYGVRARLLRPRWLPGPLGVLPMTMTR